MSCVNKYIVPFHNSIGASKRIEDVPIELYDRNCKEKSFLLVFRTLILGNTPFFTTQLGKNILPVGKIIFHS